MYLTAHCTRVQRLSPDLMMSGKSRLRREASFAAFLFIDSWAAQTGSPLSAARYTCAQSSDTSRGVNNPSALDHKRSAPLLNSRRDAALRFELVAFLRA